MAVRAPFSLLDRVQGGIDPLSYRLWLAGAAVIGIGVALALPSHPFMAMGAVGGLIVVLMLLLRPLLLLGLVLAFGVVNLGFVTGGDRQLLNAMGGLDMNGIRLVGLVGGLTGLVLIDREMLARALDREGRWYLLFLLFAGGTLAVSPAPVDGLRLLFKLAYPFLLFVSVRALTRTERDLEVLGNWTLAAATFLVFLLNPLLVLAGGYTVDDTGHVRIQGLGVHQNPFSMYLLAMAVLALARYIFRGQLRYLVLALGLGGWIVLTMSRISLAATLVALLVLALYASLLRRNVKPVVAAALLGLAVAVPLTPLVLDRTLGFVPLPGELLAMVRDPGSLVGAMRWQGREALWPILLGAFLGSPFVGLGLGASGAVLRNSLPSSISDVPHNEYLRLLVETGVIGVALLAAGVLVWWVTSARAGLRLHGSGREYAVAAVAIVPAAAVLSFTDNTIDYYAQFTQFVAFFCAATLAARRFELGDTDAEHDAGAGHGATGPVADQGPGGTGGGESS
jgi:putative inorganic carbon (hco3(-)) transporter